MRDFRHSKTMASALRTELEAKGLALPHAEALELIAKLFGISNWNTLSARIKQSATVANDDPAAEPTSETPDARPSGFPNWFAFAKPFYDKHLTAEDKLVPAATARAGWQRLFDEANILHDAGEDPESVKVLDLTRRWLDYSHHVSGDNMDYKKKSYAAYQEALNDKNVAAHLPLSAEVFSFLEPAFRKAWSERPRRA